MKQEPNNEIDLMLRKLGQMSNRAQSESGNSSPAEVHLDADELNAYAENVLPPAARARYTRHLVECSECRQLVSQISLSAGLVRQEEVVEERAASGFKTFLSALFSPLVLRYAVPALSLIVVASIAFLVFRNSTSRVASLHDGVASKSPSVDQLKQKEPERETRLFDSTSSNTSAEKRESDVVTEKPKSQEESAARNSRSTVGGQVADDQKAAKESQGPAAQGEVHRTSPAAETAAAQVPAAAPQPTVVAEQKFEVAQRKDQPASPNADEVKPSETELAKAPARSEPASISGFRVASSDVAKNKTEAGDKRARSDRDTTRGREGEATNETETKSIAGHQFRRQGSVWIDVNYKAPRETVNVARDSEQYRVLIADEPVIKTISDQLKGTVIVVLKRRAYRIY